MKRAFYLIFLLAALSCAENEHSESNQNSEKINEQNMDSPLVDNVEDIIDSTTIEFGEPIVLKSTENIAIPIILENEYKDKLVDDYSYFNMAIIDHSNKVKRMLFDESVVIKNITTIEEESPYYKGYYNGGNDEVFSTLYNSLVFLEVSKITGGKQSKIKQLYVYNLATDNLQLLTPEKSHLKDWKVYKDQPKVVMNVILDSNQDDVYDENDDENILVSNPTEPTEIQPLFDIDLLKEIKLKVLKEN